MTMSVAVVVMEFVVVVLLLILCWLRRCEMGP